MSNVPRAPYCSKLSRSESVSGFPSLEGFAGRRQGPSSKVMAQIRFGRRTCSMRRTGLKYTGVRARSSSW